MKTYNEKSPLIGSFILGVIVSVIFINLFITDRSDKKITYLPKFEITNPKFFPIVTVQGTYLKSNRDINLVNLECYLDKGICLESTVFITRDGITGMVPLKEYEIIEKTPTRIVAKYEGLAAFHMFTVDLATKKAIFKNEANTDSSDVVIYELEDGMKVLEKYNDLGRDEK